VHADALLYDRHRAAAFGDFDEADAGNNIIELDVPAEILVAPAPAAAPAASAIDSRPRSFASSASLASLAAPANAVDEDDEVVVQPPRQRDAEVSSQAGALRLPRPVSAADAAAGAAARGVAPGKVHAVAPPSDEPRVGRGSAQKIAADAMMSTAEAASRGADAQMRSADAQLASVQLGQTQLLQSQLHSLRSGSGSTTICAARPVQS